MRKIAAFVLANGVLLAQHEYRQVDVEEGGRLFLNLCAVCHGPDGNQVPGIDFGHGKLRRAYTDEELVNIIHNGISGTGMPAQTNMRAGQAESIVAYLRTIAAAPNTGLPANGNAAQGKAVFEGKGQCLTCHRVKESGSRLGPDLTDIGTLRRAADLAKSLADPGAEVMPQNRFVRVVPKSGPTVTGRILNQDTFTVQIIDERQRLLSFPRSDLKEMTFVKTTSMPSYKEKLTPQELADVVAYLTSLKGI
jgi:putative heme-binding domain-containing protein